MGRRRRWPVAVAALVAASLVALLGGGRASTSPRRSRSAPAPLRVATATEAIWVTSEPDGTLTRLDPDSGEPVGTPLRLGAGISGVAVGAGSVWVSDPPRGEVLRVDPETGRVARHESTSAASPARSPSAAAASGSPTKTAPGSARSTPRAARSTDAASPRTRRRCGSRSAPAASGSSSASTGTVRRIDLSSLRAGAPIPVGRGPAGVTVAHGLVWVANSRGGTVTRVDPSIHAVLGDPIEVGGRPGGIDAGTSSGLGRQRRRGHRHPPRPRERRPDRRRRSASAPNRAPSPSARPPSGSPTTAKAPSPASNPDADGPETGPYVPKSARRPVVVRIGRAL